MCTRTWKDTYLFYGGNTYKEYGATRITEETFLSYQNAQALKDKNRSGSILEEEPGAYNPGQMRESLSGGSWPEFRSEEIEVVY